MKVKDIEVGAEYEAIVSATLVHVQVITVETRTRRVHSNERSDFGGHSSTGPVVDVVVVSSGRKATIVPGSVKRLWSEAVGDHEAAAALKERVRNAANALQEAGLPATRRWDSTNRVEITLSVEAAEALAERLAEAQVARVEALCAEWDKSRNPILHVAAGRVRTELRRRP